MSSQHQLAQKTSWPAKTSMHSVVTVKGYTLYCGD